MLFSYDEWPGGHNIATTPRMWRRILEQWGGTIGLNFDPSHLVLQMIDMRRFLKEFGPHVLHFQAKDLMIDRDGLYERGVFSHGHGLADPAHPGPRRGGLGGRLLASSTARATRATASSSTRTGASRAPTRRSSRASSSPATSSARTASERPGSEPHGTHASTDLTERDIAKTIDHSLLRPGARRRLRRGRLPAGGEVRRRVGLRPPRGRRARAKAILDGTDVKVGTTIGFPHGNHATETKVLEARRALADGATELDMVHPDRRAQVRPGRRTSRPTSGRSSRSPTPPGAIVKVIFENAYLTDDEKIRACRLTEAAGGDFVKTSTGFAPSGATHDDLRLMRANTSPHVQVKAAGGVRTLDALLDVMDAGRHPHRRHGDRGDHPRLPGPQGRAQARRRPRPPADDGGLLMTTPVRDRRCSAAASSASSTPWACATSASAVLDRRLRRERGAPRRPTPSGSAAGRSPSLEELCADPRGRPRHRLAPQPPPPRRRARAGGGRQGASPAPSRSAATRTRRRTCSARSTRPASSTPTSRT